MDRSPERLLMALIHQEFGDRAVLDVSSLIEAQHMGGYRVEYDERDNTLWLTLVHEPARITTEGGGIYSPDQGDAKEIRTER